MIRYSGSNCVLGDGLKASALHWPWAAPHRAASLLRSEPVKAREGVKPSHGVTPLPVEASPWVQLSLRETMDSSGTWGPL